MDLGNVAATSIDFWEKRVLAPKSFFHDKGTRRLVLVTKLPDSELVVYFSLYMYLLPTIYPNTVDRILTFFLLKVWDL